MASWARSAAVLIVALLLAGKVSTALDPPSYIGLMVYRDGAACFPGPGGPLCTSPLVSVRGETRSSAQPSLPVDAKRDLTRTRIGN